MKPLSEYTALEMARRCALILLAFSIIFSALLAGAHQLTKETIAKNIQAERLKIIQNLLPDDSYNNDLLHDFLTLPPKKELGQRKKSQLLFARNNGVVTAFLLEAIPPDGYGGNIRLMIAIDAKGHLMGAEVLEHHETPGLGDYVAKKKWLQQFKNNKNKHFRIQKDGGDILYRAGATISARAVTNAISRAVEFVAHHRRDFLQARNHHDHHFPFKTEHFKKDENRATD